MVALHALWLCGMHVRAVAVDTGQATFFISVSYGEAVVKEKPLMPCRSHFTSVQLSYAGPFRLSPVHQLIAKPELWISGLRGHSCLWGALDWGGGGRGRSDGGG